MCKSACKSSKYMQNPCKSPKTMQIASNSNGSVRSRGRPYPPSNLPPSAGSVSPLRPSPKVAGGGAGGAPGALAEGGVGGPPAEARRERLRARLPTPVAVASVSDQLSNAHPPRTHPRGCGTGVLSSSPAFRPGRWPPGASRTGSRGPPRRRPRSGAATEPDHDHGGSLLMDPAPEDSATGGRRPSKRTTD